MVITLYVISEHPLWGKCIGIQCIDAGQKSAWASTNESGIGNGTGISPRIGPRCFTNELKRPLLERPVNCRDTQGVVTVGGLIAVIARSRDFHAEHRAIGQTA